MSDTKNKRPFFIPPALDDLPLKPAPFRVLCHLLRRAGSDGVCHPKVDSIATACHIGEDTAWRAIRELEASGLICRNKRFGTSNFYTIDLSGWPSGTEDQAASNHPENHTIDGAPITPDFIDQSPGKSYDNRMKNRVGRNPIKESQEKETINNIINAIFSAYPRKVGKPVALKAIEKALKKIDGNELLAIVKAYASAITWKESQFIPHPSTWFNQERWNDDQAEWKEPAKTSHQSTPPVNTWHRQATITEI